MASELVLIDWRHPNVSFVNAHEAYSYEMRLLVRRLEYLYKKKPETLPDEKLRKLYGEAVQSFERNAHIRKKWTKHDAFGDFKPVIGRALEKQIRLRSILQETKDEFFNGELWDGHFNNVGPAVHIFGLESLQIAPLPDARVRNDPNIQYYLNEGQTLSTASITEAPVFFDYDREAELVKCYNIRGPFLARIDDVDLIAQMIKKLIHHVEREDDELGEDVLKQFTSEIDAIGRQIMNLAIRCFWPAMTHLTYVIPEEYDNKNGVYYQGEKQGVFHTRRFSVMTEFIEKLWVEVLTGMVDEPHSRVTSMDVEKAQVQDEMTRFGICRLLRFRLPMGTKGIPPRKFSVETDEDENGRYNCFVDMFSYEQFHQRFTMAHQDAGVSFEILSDEEVRKKMDAVRFKIYAGYRIIRTAQPIVPHRIVAPQVDNYTPDEEDSVPPSAAATSSTQAVNGRRTRKRKADRIFHLSQDYERLAGIDLAGLHNTGQFAERTLQENLLDTMLAFNENVAEAQRKQKEFTDKIALQLMSSRGTLAH